MRLEIARGQNTLAVAAGQRRAERQRAFPRRLIRANGGMRHGNNRAAGLNQNREKQYNKPDFFHIFAPEFESNRKRDATEVCPRLPETKLAERL